VGRNLGRGAGRAALTIATGTLERLAGCRGVLARASGFPFGFLQSLAGALEFFFRDADTLFRHVRLQADALKGFRRRVGFAACLLHLRLGESVGSKVSHKKLPLTTTLKLSTEFVHNYVDRAARSTQRLSPSKNLRHGARVFATVRFS
jgi:hypothetical protein